AAELEVVEVDAAEAQHRGSEHVAQRPRLLFDHALRGQRLEDAVDGRVGEPELGRQVAETQSACPLERQQDADSTVDGLDHGDPTWSCRADRFDCSEDLLTRAYQEHTVRIAFDNVEYSSAYGK